MTTLDPFRSPLGDQREQGVRCCLCPPSAALTWRLSRVCERHESLAADTRDRVR